MSYRSTILADSPTAYYRLDELSGSTAIDSSGNGYNGTVSSSGVTYSQAGAIVGDTDTCMLFSSTAQLALPYTLNPSTWTALSLEYWIKLSSGWQYVVITTSNTTGITTIYLNGSVYTSGTGDFIGIDTDIYYAGSPQSGDLDEVALYNYVLTPAQIINHYLAGLAASAFYVSNVASTISSLILSDQMSQTTGGAETSVSITAPSSGNNLYIELLSQGGTSSGTPALPAPTGKGWSIPLQGYTITAGNWQAAFTLAKSGAAMSGASLYVRFYRRTMDGTYYAIGSSVLNSQTLSTTKTTYFLPSASATLWQFIANDTLYVDAFAFNGNTAWASDVFTVYVSNSAGAGVFNDGTIFSPQMITTPPGLSCYVGMPSLQSGATLPVKNESFVLADALDQRSVLTLTGEDTNGNLSYTPNMPVVLSDHDQGKLYDGYLASDKMSRVVAGPGSPQLEHQLTCADHHRDVDKRANTTNYLNWQAGDIVCDFIQQTLNQEGVTGEFALESDYTPSTFSQGTLNGTIATTTTTPFTYAPNTATPPVTSNTGDLELTRAGTQFTLTESVTSDFASGTLTNMVASGNALTPTTQSALRTVVQFPLNVSSSNTASAPLNNTSNIAESLSNYAYAEIWSGSMTVASNDTINYDLWIASTSPAFMAGIDLLFSDGSLLSSYTYGTPDDQTGTTGYAGISDQNGVSADFLTDLSTYAKDAWYTRQIPLTGLSGKTITAVMAKITGSATGIYTVYVKNIYLGSQSGSPFLSTTATTTQIYPPVVGTRGGYIPIVINDVVQVYQPALSTRISPAHSISTVGLVQNSTISWTASLPASGTFTDIVYPPGTSAPTSTNGTQGAMNIYVSYDASTWLLCTNQSALPGLPPGANIAGTSLYLKEQFQAGSDPTALPSLLQVQITINSAAATTTSDVVAAYGSTSQWNTGTYNGTAVNSNGDLVNGGTYRPNWTTFDYTYWASAGSGTPSISTTSSTLTISNSASGNSNNLVLSLDDVLPLTNGTIECDVSTSSAGSNQWSRTGIIYRGGNWQAGWNSATGNSIQYAPLMQGYLVYIQADTANSTMLVALISLSMTGTASNIGNYTTTISQGTTYHLKVVFNGNRHTVYFNHGANPIIDMVDTVYTGAGRVGLYSMGTQGSSSTSHQTSIWSNYTCTPLATGTWISPSIALSGTCGYTQISWSELATNGAQQSTAVVLTRVNGNVLWQQCANGAEIPLLIPGTSVSSLQIQVILYSNPGITAPTITGLYARVCGNYGTVTGTRISPALSLTPVGYITSSNCMWNANTPTGTSVVVASSQDSATWTNVGNNGAGAALPYWNNQPSATQDLFSANTTANYTNTSKSGGSSASVTYDTTNSRITLAGGSGGLYLNNSINCADVDLLCDMDESDAGGLCWHVVDTSDYYELGVYDASSSGGFTNQLRLYKVSGGSRTLLGSASSITFTRGTFHRVRVKMKSGLINVYWDGQCVQSYLDTSPLGAGQVGLRNDGGASRYYQLWCQPLGTNLSGQVLYTKVTMSTSDPQYMPQLFTLVCCVRGPSIATGATIYQLHPPTLPFAAYYSAEMDTLVQVSGDYYWYVDKWRQLHFRPRLARPGAFPVQSMADSANSSGFLLYQPTVTVTNSADPLRNQQVVTNVIGLVTPPTEVKVADGSTTSWALGYPVHSAPTILVSGQPATVGIQGIDDNKQFYWQPGSPSISYDSSLPKLPAGTVIDITYVGESTINVIVPNNTAIAAQAAIEGNSGIIAEIEDANSLNTTTAATFGMTQAQATAFANGLLARYGNNDPVELTGTTMYPGLVPGTVIPLFLPEMGQWNAQLPIVKLTTTAYQGTNGMVYLYSIDATNGANLTSWARVWF
jgi:hypothetical protein